MKSAITSLTDEFKTLSKKLVVLENEQQELKKRCDSLERDKANTQRRGARAEVATASWGCLSHTARTSTSLQRVAAAVQVPFQRFHLHSTPPFDSSPRNTLIRLSSLSLFRVASRSRGLRLPGPRGISTPGISLQPSRVYIKDHLTSFNKALLERACRLVREKRIHFAGYFNGKVLIRPKEGDDAVRVLEMDDLDQFDRQGRVVCGSEDMLPLDNDNADCASVIHCSQEEGAKFDGFNFLSTRRGSRMTSRGGANRAVKRSWRIVFLSHVLRRLNPENDLSGVALLTGRVVKITKSQLAPKRARALAAHRATARPPRALALSVLGPKSRVTLGVVHNIALDFTYSNKHFHQLAPPKNRDFHSYHTRHGSRYNLPVHRTTLSEKKPSYAGCRFQNHLPAFMKDFTGDRLRRELKTWLLKEYYLNIKFVIVVSCRYKACAILTRVNHSYGPNIKSSDMIQKIERWEKEVSQALDLAAGYKEKSEVVQSQMESFKRDTDGKLAEMRTELENLNEENKRICNENTSLLRQLEAFQEKLKEEEDLLSKLKNELEKSKKQILDQEAEISVIKEQKETVSLMLKEERNRSSMLEQQKVALQQAADEAVKREVS
ncbi:hypothetical protein J6590_024379 [Homalodisca vitripennis]|nr:hypothetical protein J6590_024379 [Homalodisca vitripennis]